MYRAYVWNAQNKPVSIEAETRKALKQRFLAWATDACLFRVRPPHQAPEGHYCLSDQPDWKWWGQADGFGFGVPVGDDEDLWVEAAGQMTITRV